jgi:hypothetical protein
MEISEQYQRFIAWQCRLRKQSMREHGGRPSAGMGAGVYSVSGGDEQSQVQFLILRRDSEPRTAEFRHIVRKTPDSSEWLKNGLRILAEMHYQETDQFQNRISALFGLNSALADALLDAGACHLKFSEKGIDYGFDFDVEALAEADELYQATYWHNRLFNPTLPGKVRILGFTPRLDDLQKKPVIAASEPQSIIEPTQKSAGRSPGNHPVVWVMGAGSGAGTTSILVIPDGCALG